MHADKKTCSATSHVVFNLRSTHTESELGAFKLQVYILAASLLASVRVAANCCIPAWRPPRPTVTPPLKFICRLVITERVNVSPPPLCSFSRLPVRILMHSSAVSNFPLPHPRHHHHHHLLCHHPSPPLLRSKLLITVTKSTLVYKSLL